MVPVVPFIVTGSPCYVKGRAGTGMSNGHNVGLCREKRFTDSVQGPERHNFCSGNTSSTTWRCSEKGFACRLLRQNWWAEGW